ncbi:hypothetical protein EDB81DRAFT_799057 [Dactylonectria macrodidyma]|uniref:DUF7702 domain-containing protein n=1 Tax=Dactylonectria macrodidyma TaxID=307937 RepID=A0A9P9EPL5_9HYPO|nr:hypothetical protein EDB81DRAFT_799057 [Dactylonectria macrodidyma]
MLNPHTSVAIAQVIFFVPIVPVAMFILVKNWKNRPRLPWYPLVTFSLLRLAGGIITIIRDSHPTNIGLIIAATVLLNVGIIPLLLSLIGITRIVLKSSVDKNHLAQKCLKAIRIAFIAAIALLVASGGLSGSSSTATIARSLAQAGYVVLGVVLALTALELLHLYTQKDRICPNAFIYVEFALLSIPMLALRAAYGLLYEFTIKDLSTIWNPLSGSAVAFALMCLLSEYLALLLFIYLGFHRMKHNVAEMQKVPTGGDLA